MEQVTIYEAFRQLAAETTQGSDYQEVIDAINLLDGTYSDDSVPSRINTGFKAWQFILPKVPHGYLRHDPKLWWGKLASGYWREIYRDPTTDTSKDVAQWIVKGIKSGRHKKCLFVTF